METPELSDQQIADARQKLEIEPQPGANQNIKGLESPNVFTRKQAIADAGLSERQPGARTDQPRTTNDTRLTTRTDAAKEAGHQRTNTILVVSLSI